jgi:hypothetical protein
MTDDMSQRTESARPAGERCVPIFDNDPQAADKVGVLTSHERAAQFGGGSNHESVIERLGRGRPMGPCPWHTKALGKRPEPAPQSRGYSRRGKPDDTAPEPLPGRAHGLNANMRYVP